LKDLVLTSESMVRPAKCSNMLCTRQDSIVMGELTPATGIVEIHIGTPLSSKW
jgi:hypothetical protein